MPRPRRPRTAFPTAAAVAAQGLTVDQVDPDHLTFLEHVRPDGNSYAVELPARGGAPPVTVKYEAGTPAAASGKAPIAPVLSPAPAGSGRVVDREGNPLWYETAENMDEDYRKFWRQTYMENGRLVLQVEDDKIVRYDLDAVPVRISDIADGAKKKGGEEVGGGGGVGAVEKEITAPIKADRTALEHRVGDSLVISQKKKAEQGQEENGKNEGKGGAEKIKVVKRKGEMLNELPVKTLNAVNRETNSSNGHAVGPHPASTDNRKPPLRRSPRLMLCSPENGHK